MYIPVVRCVTPNGSSSCVDGIIYHQVSVCVAPASMMRSI